MKLLLICGPWGSGTSAIAGVLDRIGGFGLRPYFRTNDPLTPNSYEATQFRRIILQYVREADLTIRPSAPGALEASLRELRDQIENQAFGHYDRSAPPPVFLKFPPSALLIPQIVDAFDTHLIYVNRPLADIERSRLRRNWPPVYGQAGAALIYRQMEAAAAQQTNPVLRLAYPDLLAAPLPQARVLARFAGLEPSEDALRQAVDFVAIRS